MRWQLTESNLTPSPELLALVDQQPIIAALLAGRGYADAETARGFLHPHQYRPMPPSALPGLETAARLLYEAIQAQKTILIWGDFDVDGQTASALLLDALRPLTPVCLHIPIRERDSHGIQLDRLQARIDADAPAVLLTCDTGSSANAAIDYANARALTTIITDHHDLPLQLPDADAIINPKLLPPDHPLVALPGVGVAFKLIQQLYSLLGRDTETAQFLDLVALGIVADVAAQVNDTRYLLQIGLERLRHTERPGLRALLEVSRLDPLTVSAEQIGFQIGPRLNAAGRLGDACLSVELLTARDPQQTLILAQQLEGLNLKRRQLQRDTEAAARQLIEADPSLLDYGALVLHQPDWQAGILGPVAGRLVEEYGRPVVLLSNVDEHTARGSARSAAGYDINAAISASAGLLIAHGGHPGAAGVTLPLTNVAAFRRALSESLRLQTRPDSENARRIDTILPLDAITAPLVNALQRLAPFGEGNPPIVFETDQLVIISASFVDRQHAHRRLIVQDANGTQQSVYWWNSGSIEIPDAPIDLAYTLSQSAERGIEMTLVDYLIHDRVAAVPRIGRRLVDQRMAAEPRAQLDQLKATMPGLSIWAEGFAKTESPGEVRHTLSCESGCALAIYTAPPTPAVLAEVLERLNPSAVYVFGVEPPAQSPTEFLRQLEGILKFVGNRQGGRVSLETLCGRTAQSEAVMRAALNVLGVTLIDNRIEREAVNTGSLKKLSALLEESRAYRDYFRRAPVETILL